MNRNLLVMVGAVLMIIGSFLPWASMGEMSISGTSAGAGDGWISVILGALLIAVSFVSAGWRSLVLMILAAISAAFGVWKLIEALDIPAPASIGIGIWLLAIGGVLALVGAVMSRRDGAEAGVQASV